MSLSDDSQWSGAPLACCVPMLMENQLKKQFHQDQISILLSRVLWPFLAKGRGIDFGHQETVSYANIERMRGTVEFAPLLGCWDMRAGLTSEDEDKDFVLEASQGDRISGKISRKEVASVAVAALSTAASVGE